MAGDPLSDVLWQPVTILNTASLSNALNVQGYDVVALQQPVNVEGTAYSFQASLDGATFADLYDNEGTEVSATKSATLAQVTLLTASMAAPPGDISIKGVNSIKVRTGLTGAASAQNSDVIIMVGLRTAGG